MYAPQKVFLKSIAVCVGKWRFSVDGRDKRRNNYVFTQIRVDRTLVGSARIVTHHGQTKHRQSFHLPLGLGVIANTLKESNI